jgi:GTP-binding protein HflX
LIEGLILNIFHSRATTTESKLQIELAEVKYEMPRVREKAKLTLGSTERPGKGGIGEYRVDVKFQDLKRRMSFIKQKLAGAHTKRELYRQQRLKTKMPIVSLIGYTSSGKTTLFNLLTAENKEISSSLFTTLSTTTRAFRINNEKQERESYLLLVDTVGFISRLPYYMIDAFKSTLQESLAADLILLLIDASEKFEDIKIKYESCWNVLDELKVDKSKVFTILTKCDDGAMGLSEGIDNIANYLSISNPIIISSNTGYGIRKLKTMIAHNLNSQAPSRKEHLTNVKTVPEEGAYVITATDLHS